MVANNPYQETKKITLETLSRNEVVIKLFEEASKQIKLGIFLIDKNESAKAYNAIAKAQKIVSRLNFALDMDYPISVELNNMYNFIFEQLGVANAKKDVELLNKMWKMVNELKDTFKEADKISGGQRSGW
ncbi:flagellar export chaperone FliS [Eubacteriaceae bacterium ES2]|nr:flagellar export chaperone FliS [Eubacteriaceae bacterium ES2]